MTLPVPEAGRRLGACFSWWDAVLVPALVAVFLYFAATGIQAGPYSYDEADYMYAASLGFFANYTESPSLSVIQMARSAMGIGVGEERRADLSALIRNSGDVSFYRHWHGPLFVYWLAAVYSRERPEQHMRALNLVFPLFSFLVVYAGCLWLLPDPQRRVAAVLCGCLVLWSYPAVRSAGVYPHQLFALCCLTSLILLAKAVASGGRRYWYCAVVMAGLVFCQFGVAFVLAATLVLVGWVERRRLTADRALVLNSVLVLVGTVLVVWPAAVLRLSILKTYAMMAYLAAFRRGAWGDVGFLETWRTRFQNSPIEWLLLVLGVVLYVRQRRRPGPDFAFPFLVFGGLMTLTLLRQVTDVVHYLTPFLPPLLVFAGLTTARGLAAWRPGARVTAAAGLCTILFWNTQRQVAAHPLTQDPRPTEVLALLRERQLGHKSLLVPRGDVPMIHYYFPGARLTGYLETDPAAGERGQPIYDAVLHPGYPVRLVVRGAE